MNPVSHTQVNDVHPDWFALATAVSSSLGCVAIAFVISFLLLLTLVRRIAPLYGFAGVAALMAFSFGGYFGCEQLRNDALRGIQFTPFFSENGRLVAGYDLRKYAPIVISDWPWSERAFPPNTGSVNGVVTSGGGRAIRGAVV